MKNLDLNEMEIIEGGNSCNNLGNALNAGSTAVWALSALAVASTGGLALFVVGGALLAGSYYNCL